MEATGACDTALLADTTAGQVVQSGAPAYTYVSYSALYLRQAVDRQPVVAYFNAQVRERRGVRVRVSKAGGVGETHCSSLNSSLRAEHA